MLERSGGFSFVVIESFKWATHTTSNPVMRHPFSTSSSRILRRIPVCMPSIRLA